MWGSLIVVVWGGELDQLYILARGNWFSLERENLGFHKHVDVNHNLLYLCWDFSWCYILSIQTLPNVFIIHGDLVFHFSSISFLKFNQSSQSTNKACNCKGGHVPTCVLGDEPNLPPPHPPPQLPPPLHMEVLGQKDAWRYRKTIHQRRGTLFCFARTIETWKCALTWARLTWGPVHWIGFHINFKE